MNSPTTPIAPARRTIRSKPRASGACARLAAVQAYLEWMPVRDPVPGSAREAIWRKFEIGDLATLFLLESRLVGRGEDLTFDEMFLAADADRPAIADSAEGEDQRSAAARCWAPSRKHGWREELKTSAASGKKWQVLGNQVTMAKVKMPDLQSHLPPEKYETGLAGREAILFDRALGPGMESRCVGRLPGGARAALRSRPRRPRRGW